MKLGFDINKYLLEQTKFIEERVNNCDHLLRIGGKLFNDLRKKEFYQVLMKMLK